MTGVPVQAASARGVGKVILLGEHAVVYGSPAIAIGLTRGAEADVRRSSETSLSLGESVYVLGPESLSGAELPPARAFRALLSELSAPPVSARATLAVPAGAGLGASAALGVALARAVALLGQGTASSTESIVERAALAWENVFHGNASGIDTAAAQRGGCLWFTRAGGPSQLRVGRALHVVVAVVEPGASTRVMVEGVAERRRVDRRDSDLVMEAIKGLVEGARDAIERGARSHLGDLMTQNHELLARLGVSTQALDDACRRALRAGALGAKLTGAGGGGCVIALVDEAKRSDVLAAWAQRGFTCLEATASEASASGGV
jgi:mevalonate kinase